MSKYSVSGTATRHKGAGIIGMGLSEFSRGGGPPPPPEPAKKIRARNNWLGKKMKKAATAAASFSKRAKIAKRKKCATK
jgi:hypothetical protein